jgi:hypothetical protein
LDSFEITWTHLNSFECTWIHLGSLELSFTCFHLPALDLTLFYLIPEEKGKALGRKRKSWSMRFEMHFHLAFHRAHARTAISVCKHMYVFWLDSNNLYATPHKRRHYPSCAQTESKLKASCQETGQWQKENRWAWLKRCCLKYSLDEIIPRRSDCMCIRVRARICIWEFAHVLVSVSEYVHVYVHVHVYV